ncbi:hypothetical protein MXL54_11075 [Enterobacteriaceae bacterium G50]|nr:hypothetical protein [Enterobacteriaceae bacterium G50]
MSDEVGSTQGTTQNGDNIIDVNIKNNFEIKVSQALADALKLLYKRKKELIRWNPEDEKNFSDVFGVEGDSVIEEEYSTPTTNPKTGKIELGIFTEKKTARNLMKGAVNRMIFMAEMMNEKSFKNFTDVGDYYAKVAEQQSVGLSPERYNTSLNIFIGQKFVHAPPFGQDSKACTICHELSHFVRYINDFSISKKNEIKGNINDICSADGRCDGGGMGTLDLYGAPTPRDHAIKMRNQHSKKIFRNAYNVELYFEDIL